MNDMDVKIISNESSEADGFEHHALSDEVEAVEKRDAGVSQLVKMKFPNFAKLVATHSFENVLEKNAQEEVVLSADLLADLANAEPMDDERRRQMMILFGGVLLGLLIGFLFLGDL